MSRHSQISALELLQQMRGLPPHGPTVSASDRLVSFLERHREPMEQLNAGGNWAICGGATNIGFHLAKLHFELKENAFLICSNQNSIGYSLRGSEAVKTFVELSNLVNLNYDRLVQSFDPLSLQRAIEDIGFLTFGNYFFKSFKTGMTYESAYQDFLKDAQEIKMPIHDAPLSRLLHGLFYQSVVDLLSHGRISMAGIEGIKPGGSHRTGSISIFGDYPETVFFDFSSRQFHPDIPLIVAKEKKDFCFQENQPSGHRVAYVPSADLYPKGQEVVVGYRFENNRPEFGGQITIDSSYEHLANQLVELAKK